MRPDTHVTSTRVPPVKRTRRTLRIAALLTAALLLLAAAGAWLMLRASLPTLDGHATLPGAELRVTIERDAAGVTTIRARDRLDLARGLGYAHGQDRFFQMDLMRRAAAGELAALAGPNVLSMDREARVHRFRSVARAVVAAAPASDRALLEAYASGVNAGLASLRVKPFEYWILGATPKPWSAEDTILCSHAMYLQLQDSTGHGQLQRGLLRATLPEAAWRFLEAGAPEWDAAIDGSVQAEPRLPGADEYDLRRLKGLPTELPTDAERGVEFGSNNWAVGGALTAHGAGLIANDMHLNFQVPIIWYRARLVLESAREGLDVAGVSLPGAPVIIAGSNRSIAWGFTNSYGDFSTVVRLVPAPGDASAYATAQGARPYAYVDETIEVKGAPAEHLKVAMTEWGPVIGEDWEGKPYALQWTAQDPAATNFNLIALERVRSAEEALRAAPQFGMPGQNLMVADRDGHIGWTIAGRLPRHARPGPRVPELSTDPSVGFDGWLNASEQPRVIDPPGGLLWSANARVVGGSDAVLIGDDGMDRGARAGQIHADLAQAPRPLTPASSLAVQLDDRALFLERWRALLRDLLEREHAQGHDEHEAARAVLASWSGHAAPEDAAYRLVQQFRLEAQLRAFYMLVAPARQKAPSFRFEIPSSFEGPVWRLLHERPPHLLSASYADWDALLLDSLRAAERLPVGCRTLAACTWGDVNAVHIAHPLSAALPLASRFLDMPTVRVPGARHDMPRIQGPDYGASERFSVSPGREDEGYFHMPGAQSGHPLSPFYRAGFENWQYGRPSPFMPGPAAHTLVLAGSATSAPAPAQAP